MKREEIEAQVKEILDNQIDANIISYGNSLKELTDLFIKLSNERCREQRQICADSQPMSVPTKWIMNAPLPEIN